MVLTVGGFLCGLLAGAAARYGRLCSMSAIEDAVIGGNWRGIKAWGLTLAVAIITTQTAVALHLVDPDRSIYAATKLDWFAAALGGFFFGCGMALTGTCSFGLLVRSGGGDLRALVSTMLIGITAFAFLIGPLFPARSMLTDIAAIDLPSRDQAFLPNLIGLKFGTPTALVLCAFTVIFLISSAASDGRLLRRPRLMFSAVVLGTTIALGWLVTGLAYQYMETARIESLSFVAPAGRLLLETMGTTVQDAEFGIASLFGVVCGSLLIAVGRSEFQLEAFDDAREMRRHFVGATLMAGGGVLAKGCTIGQGLTAGSLLSVAAPLTIIGILLGAKFGLAILLHEPMHAISKSE